jgi:hypothetical protein
MAQSNMGSIRTFEATFDPPYEAARFLEHLEGKFGCLEGHVYAFSGYTVTDSSEGARILQVNLSPWNFRIEQIPKNERADFAGLLSAVGAREVVFRKNCNGQR